MDLMLPPWIPVAEAEWRLIDFTGRSQTTLSGAQKRVSRGQRLGVQLRFQNLSGVDRAALMAYVAALRGSYGTAILYDPANRQRGSFGGAELLTNPTFANGTTGYAAGTEAALSVTTSRALRVTRTSNAAAGGAAYASVTGVASVSQWVPYAWRAHIAAIRGTVNAGPTATGTLQLIGSGFDVGAAAALRTTRLLATAAGVPGGLYLDNVGNLVSRAGEFYEVDYASLQRCALFDGGPNEALYASTLQNAAWSKTNLTATDNVHLDGDGSSTLSNVLETTATGGHYLVQNITRPSIAEDLCAFGVFCRNVGTRDVRLVVGSDASNYAVCTFDLGAGTAGSATVVGTATNARAYIVSLGNSRYACYLIARVAASTTLYLEYDMVSGGSTGYTGTTGSIGAGMLGAAHSSFPVRITKTTSAAASGTGSAGLGYAYLKGLPVSTSGLVLAGDRVEVNGEMKIATADLNSDAAGLGYLQFEPVLRAAPADNAPVIIGQPTGRFVLADDAAWPTRPGMFSDMALTFVEA